MKTIETKVYEFDELNDSAKDKARDCYRQGALAFISGQRNDWITPTFVVVPISGHEVRRLTKARHAQFNIVVPK